MFKRRPRSRSRTGSSRRTACSSSEGRCTRRRVDRRALRRRPPPVRRRGADHPRRKPAGRRRVLVLRLYADENDAPCDGARLLSRPGARTARRASGAGRRLVVARLDDERLGRRRPAPLPRGVAVPARSRRGACRAAWSGGGRRTGAAVRPARPRHRLAARDPADRRARLHRLLDEPRGDPDAQGAAEPRGDGRRAGRGRACAVLLSHGLSGDRRRARRAAARALPPRRGRAARGALPRGGDRRPHRRRDRGCGALGWKRRRRSRRRPAENRGASGAAGHTAPPVGRLDPRDRTPTDRDGTPAERRAARPRRARSQDLRARGRGGRAAARGRRRVGDRRRDRHRAVHARRQVPGAGGRRGHDPSPGQGRLPGDPGRDLHRSGGRGRGPQRRRRPRQHADRAREVAAPLDVRGAGARRLRPGVCRPAAGRPRRRRLRRAAGGRVARPVHAGDPGRGADRNAPRHDPAVPDLLRGRLLRVAGIAGRALVVFLDMLGSVITAMVTPFGADGAVDLERFRELASFLVENGSDGLVVSGTTGESPTLSDEEKLELFRSAVETVGDRATVIAGTGTYDTGHSVHLTREATELGVDGILVVTPYYNKPPQRAIVRHFEEIAAATHLPVVAYNIPGRVVVNIEPATIARLAEVENVVAVKQALDDPEQARFIAEDTRLDLYSGDDPNTVAFLELGGVGVVSVTAHLWGSQIAEMIRRHREGDVEGARVIHEELQPSYDLLRIQVNPIPIKAALNLTGHEVGGHRLPMVEADEGELAQIRSCLERSGLLATASA